MIFDLKNSFAKRKIAGGVVRVRVIAPTMIRVLDSAATVAASVGEVHDVTELEGQILLAAEKVAIVGRVNSAGNLAALTVPAVQTPAAPPAVTATGPENEPFKSLHEFEIEIPRARAHRRALLAHRERVKRDAAAQPGTAAAPRWAKALGQTERELDCVEKTLATFSQKKHGELNRKCGDLVIAAADALNSKCEDLRALSRATFGHQVAALGLSRETADLFFSKTQHDDAVQYHLEVPDRCVGFDARNGQHDYLEMSARSMNCHHNIALERLAIVEALICAAKVKLARVEKVAVKFAQATAAASP